MTKPRVKPLEWAKCAGVTVRARASSCQTILGSYKVQERAAGLWWMLILPNGNLIKKYTEQSAKAAAQSDYDARVLAALDLTPDPAVQALVEAARALQIDLLERAQMKIDAIHGEQYRIVNAGRAAWSDFCAALAAFDKTD